MVSPDGAAADDAAAAAKARMIARPSDWPRGSKAPRRASRARRVVVYSGAGVSKESGISTFRDPGEGLWAKYDPMQLATAEAYERDPAFVWRWYMDRFGQIDEPVPTPATAPSPSSNGSCRSPW